MNIEETSQKYLEILTKYHHRKPNPIIFDFPVKIDNVVLFGFDPLHKKYIVIDCDGVLNYEDSRSLTRNWLISLTENDEVKKRFKDLEACDAEIDNSPKNIERPFKEFLTILFECDVTWEQYNKACWEAALITKPVHGGYEFFSRAYTFGYGTYVDSAGPREAVERFVRIRFGIPNTQVAASNYKFKNGKFSGECDFVYGFNKTIWKDRLLLQNECVPIMGVTITDEPEADEPLILASGLDISLLVDKNDKRKQLLERGIYSYPGKFTFNRPEGRRDLRYLLPDILLQERVRYIYASISPEDLVVIIRAAKNVITIGEVILSFGASNERKEALLGSINNFLSIKNLPFPKENSKIREKVINLRTTNNREVLQNVGDIIRLIKDYLIESKLSEDEEKEILNLISRSRCIMI